MKIGHGPCAIFKANAKPAHYPPNLPVSSGSSVVTPGTSGVVVTTPKPCFDSLAEGDPEDKCTSNKDSCDDGA